jgi:hypothetical protein
MEQNNCLRFCNGKYSPVNEMSANPSGLTGEALCPPALPFFSF